MLSAKNILEPKNLEALSVEVTTKCNLRCSHCFALDGILDKKDLDLDTANHIVQEGFKLGFKRLHLTGGETFLWKPIFNLIKFAFNLGYTEIVINTNATQLTDDICNKLSHYNKDEDRIRLTCSINGNKNHHESVRGKGSYEKATAGIKKALEHNLNVNIFTTVGKKLLPDIPGFIEQLFKKFPTVKSHYFIQLRNTETRTKDILSEMLTPQDFVTLVQFMGFLSLQGHLVQILENPLANVVAYVMKMNWLPESPLIARYGKITVLCDGNITANHSSRASYGRYKTGRLQEVLESTEYLRDTTKDTETCPYCKYLNLCQSHGMLQPSSGDHNNAKDNIPFCKKVLQYLIEKANRTNIMELVKNQ